MVSVTLRGLDPAAVAALARRCALEGVEWGGDVHAPHGDASAARRVRDITRSEGLEVAAYGSYYRLGAGADGPEFSAVLVSAAALRAPLIRVWAGSRGSASTPEPERAKVTRDAVRAAELAAKEGARLCVEWHGATLTDGLESALRLLRESGHPGLAAFWQPPVGLEPSACRDQLRELAGTGRLASLHVFHWWPDEATRLPLEDGSEAWAGYLAEAALAPGSRYCCLEFVRGDAPAQLEHDAATLRRLLGRA